jgi:hypothetical protein
MRRKFLLEPFREEREENIVAEVGRSVEEIGSLEGGTARVAVIGETHVDIVRGGYHPQSPVEVEDNAPVTIGGSVGRDISEQSEIAVATADRAATPGILCRHRVAGKPEEIFDALLAKIEAARVVPALPEKTRDARYAERRLRASRDWRIDEQDTFGRRSVRICPFADHAWIPCASMLRWNMSSWTAEV